MSCYSVTDSIGDNLNEMSKSVLGKVKNKYIRMLGKNFSRYRFNFFFVFFFKKTGFDI